ncbi:MAG: nucleic acid-binding protein [Actinobacteria bacterium]|nr:nucleic acid-binding protein [Actinomycetota bacterium]
MILLDSGPLGLLANPSTKGPAPVAREWVRVRLAAGDSFVVPEIADYEVRRELLRAARTAGLDRLDELCAGFQYEPLTTPVMRDAALLWAQARNAGTPTAHDLALDGDVILAAQARSLADYGQSVVATTNTKHLERYVDAREWSDI